MSNDELISPQKQMADLRAEIADVREALIMESKSTTRYINAIYRYIAEIHDYLTPVMAKVFPGFKAAKEQIDAFMRQSGFSKKSKKSR